MDKQTPASGPQPRFIPAADYIARHARQRPAQHRADTPPWWLLVVGVAFLVAALILAVVSR